MIFQIRQKSEVTYVSKSETKHEISPLIGARRLLHLLSANKSAALNPSEYWGVTLPDRKSPIKDSIRQGSVSPIVPFRVYRSFVFLFTHWKYLLWGLFIISNRSIKKVSKLIVYLEKSFITFLRFRGSGPSYWLLEPGHWISNRCIWIINSSQVDFQHLNGAITLQHLQHISRIDT